MRSSEIRLRKLKLRLRDKRLVNHKAPCTAIWQQPLQSFLALRGCSATDLKILILSKELYQINIAIKLEKNTPPKHLERYGKIYKLTTLLRKSAVAKFRLLTGHDCLNKHFHRFGIANSLKCSFCNLNEDMERNHLLCCPTFIEDTNFPAKYWSARERMIPLTTAGH